MLNPWTDHLLRPRRDADLVNHLRGLAKLAPMLIGNVVLPYLIYVLLGDLGFPIMTALTASAVTCPVLELRMTPVGRIGETL